MQMEEKKEVRLQKYLSSAGVGSRRSSEEYIADGRVTVNGVVAELGCKVSAGDKVELDGKSVVMMHKKYLVLNKPENVICSRKDERFRKTVFDLLSEKDRKDFSLFHVGRLDYRSCGLIVLTNDGDFAHKLIHPSQGVIKGYLVFSDRAIEKSLMESFTRGIVIEGISYRAKACCRQRDNRSVLIELKEGKKREIREVFRHFSQNILKLERVFIGEMKLSDLNLKQGEYVSMNQDRIVKAIYGNGGENVGGY